MYPRITDVFFDLFGVQSPIPLYSFGLMVAMAVLVATELTRRELDRMHAIGQVPSVPAKLKKGKGVTRVEKVSPSYYVWTMMILAVILGVIGSKIFHIVDYWDRFVQNPGGLLFSASGLTFYGGLIFGTLGLVWYARTKGIPVLRLADATAPGLILAYGIGRIGCYLSGDGDWGYCSSLADKPSWLPGFLWSETFPRNYLNVDVVADAVTKAQRAGFDPAVCTGADGVYPTMLYEFGACALLAGVLWMLRKHPRRAGWLFSLYLIFAAVERYVIEIIRMNPNVLGNLSQSQVISIVLFVAGIVGLFLTTRQSGSLPESAKG